jgi:hypothetical protein
MEGNRLARKGSVLRVSQPVGTHPAVPLTTGPAAARAHAHARLAPGRNKLTLFFGRASRALIKGRCYHRLITFIAPM